MIDKSAEIGGSVEWFGENPCIILKHEVDGPSSTVGHFIRVLSSPHGAGLIAIVMRKPYPDGKDDGDQNICLTDNENLARYILDNYVAHFGSFRDTEAPSRLRFSKITSSHVENAMPARYAEIVEGEGVRLEFVWKDVLEAFAVVFPPSESVVKTQYMVSTLAGAKDGEILVNGEKCAGRTIPEETLGHKHSSAVLAFAETWINPS